MSKEPYQMAKEFHETFAPAPPNLPKAFSKERGASAQDLKLKRSSNSCMVLQKVMKRSFRI